MTSGTSSLILLVALIMVFRALGVVVEALVQAVAALASTAVSLVVVFLLLIALMTGSVGGCGQDASQSSKDVDRYASPPTER
jgi:hypothetical protein